MPCNKSLLASSPHLPPFNNDMFHVGRKVTVSLTAKSPTAITCRIINTEPPVPASPVSFGRTNFPPGFNFGAASSAYQVEGGVNEGGRGPSIWDTFTHNHPEKILDGKNGDVATDSYHKYKEDVKLLKDMGMDSYRFSISWSRILPKGKVEGGINQQGIQYYNDLINELKKNGIKPFVTLFHWDVPQALEDEYGGFLDHKIVDDFKNYCEVCFKEFGDRVQHWITLNEPWSFSSLGYGLGSHAPGRCSKVLGCEFGDSLKEPYIVAHNLILAHASAFRLYKDKFQATQKGEVGITLVSMWYKAYSNSMHDHDAAARALDFMLGWYMEPLVNGDYPFNMRALVRERLPFFTNDQVELIKGSYDFIGLNYYTARYARKVPISQTFRPLVHLQESYAEQLTENDKVSIGKLEGTWIYVFPQGLKELLLEMKERYNNPTIYITENGTCQIDDATTALTLGDALHDKARIAYYGRHLAHVQEAIKEGVEVKGFFAWSLTDNFEWEKGYTQRFGLHYVDYKNSLKRYPKTSVNWFKSFLNS